MVTTHGITSAAGYYENTVRQKKDSTVKAKNNTASEQAVKSSEDKLSSKEPVAIPYIHPDSAAS